MPGKRPDRNRSRCVIVGSHKAAGATDARKARLWCGQEFYRWPPIGARSVLRWPDNARVALAVIVNLSTGIGRCRKTRRWRSARWAAPRGSELRPGVRVLGHWLEYNEPAALDAWEKVRTFLAENLANPLMPGGIEGQN